jgi:kynurenine 3-monooxygenase
MADYSQNKDKVIVIVGGGLVGCLAACYFAQRQFQVKLFEYRSDIRQMEVVSGRSINMAMSVRGREALRGINAEEKIVSKGIEMYSRLLHDTNGQTKIIPYGKADQSILSIDRRYLNEILLNEAETYKNVEIKFNSKLVQCNTITGECEFLNLSNDDQYETEFIKAHLIVGCDGSHSAVRNSLLKQRPINFSEQYIQSYYLELSIPPKNGTFAIPVNHLHIWPRSDYMLIALPNQDCSFTCTLFMPLVMFDQLKSDEDIIYFFETNFNDALELIGRYFYLF